GLAAQKITRSQITSIIPSRENNSSIIDGTDSEPRMKTETHMRRPVLLLISKGKDHTQILAGQDIIELECNVSRVFFLLDGHGREPVTQGGVIFRNQNFGSGKHLCPNKAMVSSPDFLAFVQRAFSD